MPSMLDAVVVGAGPNGLTAAVELARRGFSVAVFEARSTVGGGARTEELTLPGFRHDPCSAAHPLGVNSPAFRAMPLERYGLEWLHARLPMAHPFLDGSAAVLARSVAETAAPSARGTRGRTDAWWSPSSRSGTSCCGTSCPCRSVRCRAIPSPSPASASRACPRRRGCMRRFHDDRARTLFAGLVAHVIAPLDGIITSGVGMVFALAAHARGWPVARGGSQSISDALTAYLKDLGGSVHTDFEVKRLDDLPPARAYVFDTSPTALARIADLGSTYAGYRYGAGVFKVDYALDGPVPWTAEEARSAGTVQVAADRAEIGAALHAAARARAPDPPFLITVQPSVADPTRAPEGKHVFWAYGHVPNGWDGDLTDAIERQLERFAPGFRDRVLARATSGPPELAARNANYVGGDIACGAASGLQLLLRPKLSLFPYATKHPAVFICSSATPPGPGVHGMSGHNAAKAVWKRLRADG